jgi:hypothetical protein
LVETGPPQESCHPEEPSGSLEGQKKASAQHCHEVARGRACVQPPHGIGAWRQDVYRVAA